MKKIFLVLSLVLAIGLVGCSSKGGQSEFKDVSTEDVKLAITSSELLVEPMPMDTNIMEYDYEVLNNVHGSIEEGFILKAGMSFSLEDVIFVKTKSPEDADKVFSALESYKEEVIIRVFGSGYGKEENATIAANTMIEKKGNYVYLIAAQNAEEIQKIILDTIQK